MTEKQVLVPGPDHPISVEPTGTRVTVSLDGRVLADSENALTLREASYPPVHYLPVADVDPAVLVASDQTSYCPFKGDADYYGLSIDGELTPDSVWTYRAPYDAVAPIKDHVAFYPDRVTVEVHGSV